MSPVKKWIRRIRILKWLSHSVQSLSSQKPRTCSLTYSSTVHRVRQDLGHCGSFTIKLVKTIEQNVGPTILKGNRRMAPKRARSTILKISSHLSIYRKMWMCSTLSNKIKNYCSLWLKAESEFLVPVVFPANIEYSDNKTIKVLDCC